MLMMVRSSFAMKIGVAGPIRQPKLDAPIKANTGGAAASQMTYLKNTECGSGRVSDNSSNTAAGCTSNLNSIQFEITDFTLLSGLCFREFLLVTAILNIADVGDGPQIISNIRHDQYVTIRTTTPCEMLRVNTFRVSAFRA